MLVNIILGKFDSCPIRISFFLSFHEKYYLSFWHNCTGACPATCDEIKCIFAHLRCSYFLSQWYNWPTSLTSWLLSLNRILVIVMRCLSVCLNFLILRSDPVQGQPFLWWVRHLKSTKRKTKIACNFTIQR